MSQYAKPFNEYRLRIAKLSYDAVRREPALVTGVLSNMVTTKAKNRTPARENSLRPDAIHIVLTGGGTGGHLYPGIAVAAEIRKRLPEARITFVGRGSAYERAEISKAGCGFVNIAARPFPQKAWDAVRFVARHVSCVREAARLLKRDSVSAVIGLGGYPSLPVARAAALQGRPLVLLEQNAVPGRANRWLAPSAALICTAFEPQRPWNTECPVQVVGSPVRREFHLSDIATASGKRRLVVLGGSQGAQSLNDQVPKALYKLGPAARKLEIVHQTGQRDCETTRELYRKLALKADVRPFIDDLPNVLAGASLVVCRAGGTTLGELTASGVPAVLVPYPYASRDHQTRNAEALEAAGAARVIDTRHLKGRLDNRLVEVLGGVLANRKTLETMTAAMRKLSRPHAASEVAGAVCELVVSGSQRRAG